MSPRESLDHSLEQDEYLICDTTSIVTLHQYCNYTVWIPIWQSRYEGLVRLFHWNGWVYQVHFMVPNVHSVLSLYTGFSSVDAFLLFVTHPTCVCMCVCG